VFQSINIAGCWLKALGEINAWISKDIDELSELPEGSASCAFSFWVGIPLDTQEKILHLCAASFSIRSVCVFRDSKWREPEDGEF
jgi:hypothetical protein